MTPLQGLTWGGACSQGGAARGGSPLAPFGSAQGRPGLHDCGLSGLQSASARVMRGRGALARRGPAQAATRRETWRRERTPLTPEGVDSKRVAGGSESRPSMAPDSGRPAYVFNRPRRRRRRPRPRPSMAPDSGRPAYVFNRPRRRRRRPRPRILFPRSQAPAWERTICEAPASRASRSRSFGDPGFPSGSLGTRGTRAGMRARLQGRFASTPEVTGSRIDDEDEDDDEDDEEGLPLSGVMLVSPFRAKSDSPTTRARLAPRPCASGDEVT